MSIGLVNMKTQFPVVILDEAAAMLEPDVIGCTLYGCKSLILVGDPKQLPLFTPWDGTERYQFNTSLLERVMEKSGQLYCNCLTMQYRMHVCDAVSTLFYDKQLVTAPKIISERKRNPAVIFKKIGFGEEKKGNLILILWKFEPKLLNAEKSNIHTEAPVSIEVMTVDSAQGREADVIILSCVRSNRQLGFLTNEKRMNVAISRAKE
ncbi:DEAD-box type RNA helicase, partial [Nowakowskiella sp. JEL0078]